MRTRLVGQFTRYVQVLFLVVLGALATACVGPIWSTVDINSARDALAEADAADAEKLAPYEYNRAVELLKKAEEEWGYSEFQRARDYAEEARDYALEAREKASTDPWKGRPEGAIEKGSEPATEPTDEATEATEPTTDTPPEVEPTQP